MERLIATGGFERLTATQLFVPTCDINIQDIMNRYSNLTILEEQALLAFLVAEKANGNLCFYDEFYPWFLTDTVDSLTAFFDLVGVNFGSIKTLFGYDFNGIDQYIETNFIPNLAKVMKFESACCATFFKKTTALGATGDGFLGVEDGVFRDGLSDYNPLRCFFQTTSPGDMSVSVIPAETLVSWDLNENIRSAYLNGVLDNQVSETLQGVPTVSYLVGCMRRAGIPQRFTLSEQMFLMVGGYGLDHDKFNTNIRTMFTTLGLI